jgi:ribosomal protein S18 acetylase RimI-like enzyme
VPIIKDTEFVYPKCEFIDIYNEKCKVFQNRKEFYNDNDIYFPKRITLTPKYRDQDLLYPQGSDVFFSKRVLDAFADEKIVGYILWLERKNYFRLYSLAIDINFQGLGIASKLLEYSFEKLRNKNFSLEVKTKNIKAIKLYEKYGFKIKKVLKDYYEDSDGYLMIK